LKDVEKTEYYKQLKNNADKLKSEWKETNNGLKVREWRKIKAEIEEIE
jgi:type III secretory pathway component EscU